MMGGGAAMMAVGADIGHTDVLLGYQLLVDIGHTDGLSFQHGLVSVI